MVLSLPSGHSSHYSTAFIWLESGSWQLLANSLPSAVWMGLESYCCPSPSSMTRSLVSHEHQSAPIQPPALVLCRVWSPGLKPRCDLASLLLRSAANAAGPAQMEGEGEMLAAWDDEIEMLGRNALCCFPRQLPLGWMPTLPAPGLTLLLQLGESDVPGSCCSSPGSCWHGPLLLLLVALVVIKKQSQLAFIQCPPMV